MATVPKSGTNVSFIAGIPWFNDYESTRWFDNHSDQRAFFDKQDTVHTMKTATFLKPDGQPRVAIDKNIDHLQGVNYMMFQNDTTTNKWFYAFVTYLEYENRQTTWAYFEIDVMQTYMFDMDIKPSFVAREHQKLWTKNDNPVRHTMDEGLDYGSSYENVYAQHILPDYEIKWMVIVATGQLHKDGGIEPVQIGIPQPLTYYLVPFTYYEDDVFTFMMEGKDEDDPVSPPAKVMKDLYEGEEAQDGIVSIYVTESIGVDYDIKGGKDSPITIVFPENSKGTVVKVSDTYMIYVEKVPAFTSTKKKVLSNKYSKFKDVKESKLLMYPYTVTVIDDFKGNRMEVRNEDINGMELALRLKGSIGLSNKISWGIDNYNRMDDAGYNDKVVSNETSIINQNPTDVPIVNDMLSAFLQGNRNSLEQQKSNAVTSGLLQTAGGVAQGVTGGPIGMAMGASTVAGAVTNTRQQMHDMNAKIEDIDNQPPSLSKMGSNTAYDYGNQYHGVWVIQKQIKDDAISRLEDFFHMYGYKSNRLKDPNLTTRKHFNYIETRSAIIQGKIANDDLNQIKTIFNNGVTLWHTDDVGNYKLDNEVK